MKTTMHFRRLFSLGVCLVLVLSLVPLKSAPAQAASANIVISQVYGGGGNSGGIFTNDFIELFNLGTATVSLDGWSVQYAGATGTGNFGASATQITPLSGSLDAGHYLLIEAAAGTAVIAPLPTPDVTDTTPISIAGTAGKVALVNTAAPLGCNGVSTPCSPAQLAQIIDLVGWGTANFFETSVGPATANFTAILRNNGGCTETDNNGADFTAGTPGPRNSASPVHFCSGPTNPSAAGAADPNVLFANDPTLLTATVTPGTFPLSTNLSVACDLREIGGFANQAFYDDSTNGDVVGGDNIFSLAATIASDTTEGVKSLVCTIGDGQGRSGSATISLTVLTIIPIGTVQGVVNDIDDGTIVRSPYAPAIGNGSGTAVVTVRGVIYEKTLQATNGASTYKGFFIQNTAATADADAKTSDGLFVFMGTSSTLNGPQGAYTPTVGDEVILSGKISEYYSMTEMTSPILVKPVLRSGVDLEAEIPAFAANPPANLADANRLWERHESMRVRVVPDSIVLGGRSVFSPADAEVWVAHPDSSIALRVDPYTRRAFRDAHPLDDNYDPNNWDGNGYRILLGSLGIKAALGDAQALIAPARTFDTVTDDPVGGVNFTFNKYRIEITSQPGLSRGPDPAANNPPQAVDPSLGYSIADYNLENLYDYRDNPFSGCDFTGNSGCPMTAPFLSNVSSPFNYVPASDKDYQARLTDIAHQIITGLHSPDILMVQEVENQDVCIVASAALICDAANNADGKPDVLQELALKIAALGGPTYEAAFDRDSSDLRGIVPAYMYRTNRVQLQPALGTDPVLGSAPVIDYAGAAVPNNSQVTNPKTLNAELPAGISACDTSWVFPRAPDIALFRVYQNTLGIGRYRDVYTINNHFKSGPDSCVAHRTEQARYNAAIVKAIQTADASANVVVGGDLNVYPRPDDPFAPLGQPGASDQLGALYDPGLGMKNLWEVLVDEAPEAAYSYVYLGMAQTLDQMLINQSMLGNLQAFRVAHINSDFPADYPADVASGTSDHDPMVAALDWAPAGDAGGPYRVDQGADIQLSATASDPGGSAVTFAWDLNNDGIFETTGQTVTYHAGLTAGEFPISLKVTGGSGSENVISTQVFVNHRYLLPVVGR